MTLIEILVAMSIFSVLGLTLAVFLRQGLATWRTGESRRAVYEEAQSLASQIRSDLRAVFATSPPRPGAGPRARLVCDLDPLGRQRLTLVRTIAGESRRPLAVLAGNQIGADADLDGRGDRAEGVAGRLRATGGLEEVLYVLDPERDGVLLRGARAPAGGAASLFRLENVDDPARLRAAASPISSRVLYFGLAFWTQFTETWDPATPPLRAPRPGRRSGPALVWDSTRALLPADPAARDDEFVSFRGEASLDDPEDDVFPEQVLVTLVVAEDPAAAIWTALAAPLKAGETEVRVLDARPFEGRGPYVRIGSGTGAEWVRLKAVEAGGRALRVEPLGGRGARGTRARDHAAGADVVTGRAFEIEVDLPAFAEDWGAAGGGGR